MTTVSFMTANFVARERGYRIADWGEGDRSVQEAFRPRETYRERFGALLDEAAALGFDAIDLWDAHLNPGWATDAHVAAVKELLDERRMTVSSLAGWFGADASQLQASCEIAVALGAPVLGGGTSLVDKDRATLIATLERYDLRLGIENHPAEHTPADMLARIGDGGGGRIGTTVDTGWWGTQGYDAAQAIRELAPHVMHVHLKDVRHAGEPHETCAYGDGVVPLRECVGALREIGYVGGISVEHEPEGYDPRPEIADGRRLLDGWLAA